MTKVNYNQAQIAQLLEQGLYRRYHVNTLRKAYRKEGKYAKSSLSYDKSEGIITISGIEGKKTEVKIKLQSIEKGNHLSFLARAKYALQKTKVKEAKYKELTAIAVELLKIPTPPEAPELKKKEKAASEKLGPELKEIKRAAKKGDATAQLKMGVAYHDGKGVSQDHKKAFAYYKMAADQKNSIGEYFLGICYQRGIGTEKNEPLAIHYLELSAKQGYIGAQFSLGHCYQNGIGVKKDPAQAIPYYKSSALQGSLESIIALGECYTKGIGVEKNIEEARGWYKLAADRGNAQSQVLLASSYEMEPKAPQLAFKYYKMAADQGDVQGQYYLGSCYLHGMGIDKDADLAVKYLKLASEQNYSPAQCSLGIMYKFGLGGIPPNPKFAFAYYKMAADQMDLDGLYGLAQCYEAGIGVESDSHLAIRYCNQAAALGHLLAKDYLEILKSKNR